MNHESAKKNFLYINSSYDTNFGNGNGNGTTSTNGNAGPAKGFTYNSESGK